MAKKKSVRLSDLKAFDTTIEVDLGEVGSVYLKTPTTKQGLGFRGLAKEGDEVVDKSIELLVALTVDETGQQIFTSPEDVQELPATFFLKLQTALSEQMGNKGEPSENPLDQTAANDSSTD